MYLLFSNFFFLSRTLWSRNTIFWIYYSIQTSNKSVISWWFQDDIDACTTGTYNNSRMQTNSTQRAMSLPSSPHEFRGQTSERSGASEFLQREEMISMWNKILQSSALLNKPLLPFEEWNIDFSELTVGTRVGIGKCSLLDLHIIATSCLCI